MAIGEASELGKSAANIFEYNEKDQKESNHERKEKCTDGFCQDETNLGMGMQSLQSKCGVVEHGKDEFLSGNDQEKDTAEDGKSLPEQLHETNLFCTGIFELVAKRRTEKVVDKVADCHIFRVRDVTERRGELKRKVLSQLIKRFFLRRVGGSLQIFCLVNTSADTGVFLSRANRQSRIFFIQGLKTNFGLSKMTIVESPRVHLHEHD